MVIRVHLRRLRPLLLRLAGNALILAGIGGLGYWAWTTGEAMLYQYVQRTEFDNAIAESGTEPGTPVPAKLSARPNSIAPQPARSKLSRFMTPDPLLIGRLEAPSLDLSVMLREGVDDDTLSKAAGHLPSSALPGEPGNFVVLGHRDTFFRPLKNVERGNLLRVVTPHGRFNYVVESFEVTDPESVKIVEGGPDRILTLVTCFPFRYIGPAPKRLVVHARLTASTGAN
jgi:sortase A